MQQFLSQPNSKSSVLETRVQPLNGVKSPNAKPKEAVKFIVVGRRIAPYAHPLSIYRRRRCMYITSPLVGGFPSSVTPPQPIGCQSLSRVTKSYLLALWDDPDKLLFRQIPNDTSVFGKLSAIFLPTPTFFGTGGTIPTVKIYRAWKIGPGVCV